MYNDLSDHLSQTKGIKSRYQTKRTFRKIIHLKQILQIQKIKAEIEIINTIEYDVSSYQVKKAILKSTQI